MKRRHGRGPVAQIEVVERLLGHRGGQFDLDHILRAMALHRETALAEHVDHAVVVGKHLREEGGDAVFLGGGREVGEHDRRDPPSLPAI